MPDLVIRLPTAEELVHVLSTGGVASAYELCVILLACERDALCSWAESFACNPEMQLLVERVISLLLGIGARRAFRTWCRTSRQARLRHSLCLAA